MNRQYRAIIGALSLAFFSPGLATAGESAPDPAAEVRAVFSARCVRCHGPQLSKPKAGFGHVLDLRRLAADPDKVVPSRPDDSGLWQQVQNDEMPPPNSPTGPLTAHEKEVIRAWIAAGAPAEAPAPMEASASPASPVLWRGLLWIGKFHLLLLHFPIALLTAAMIGEGWSVWKKSGSPSSAVRFCAGLAAVSAVPTVALGWLFALSEHGSSELLVLHRWIGTIAGVWAIALAIVSERDSRRGVRSGSTRVLLLPGVLLVSLAAHLGGLMVHGKDFYAW